MFFIATVSRVLNNVQTLSTQSETRDNVLASIEQLNYKKKLQIESKLQSFNDIKLIIPYYLTLRQGVKSYLRKNDIVIKRFLRRFRY